MFDLLTFVRRLDSRAEDVDAGESRLEECDFLFQARLIGETDCDDVDLLGVIEKDRQEALDQIGIVRVDGWDDDGDVPG